MGFCIQDVFNKNSKLPCRKTEQAKGTTFLRSQATLKLTSAYCAHAPGFLGFWWRNYKQVLMLDKGSGHTRPWFCLFCQAEQHCNLVQICPPVQISPLSHHNHLLSSLFCLLSSLFCAHATIDYCGGINIMGRYKQEDIFAQSCSAVQLGKKDKTMQGCGRILC